jgi:hypothetical protein
MLWNRLLTHLFAALLLSSGGTLIHCQSAPYPNKGANPADPEGILYQLAPDGVPPRSLALKPAERARAIRLLVAVKRDQTEWNRQLAVYLLAMLGHEYERNRDEILRVWEKNGDDGTMALLIRLYEQGHKELLAPLLARYDGWNAATSEGLGTFYSDVLEKNPQDFLAVLATFLPKRQLELCTAAGGTDGGGMAKKTERKVLANLKGIGGEVADRCARGVRAGNRDADEATQEEQKEIQEQGQDRQKKK